MSQKQQSELISEELFSGLVVRWKRGLRTFATKLAPDHPDDLVQDALLLAWQKRRLFEPGTNFFAWVCTIMLNKFRDQCDAAKRRPQEVLIGDYSGGAGGAYHDPEPEDDSAERLIALLPEAQRTVMFKHIIEEKSIREIAADLGVKYQRVQSTLHRARNTLRKRLTNV